MSSQYQQQPSECNGGAEMAFREMNLAVFEGKAIPQVFFQPRIEPWFEWHRIFGRVPERYRNLSLAELFDRLQVSMRYVHYYTGMPDPVVREFSSEVTIHEETTNDQRTVAYVTPTGELVETFKWTVDRTWRKVGFAVRGLDDLKRLRWLYGHVVYSFCERSFAQGRAFMGDRGEPQFWVPKSPYQALAQQWMKLEDLIYLLADHLGEVEATMEAIDRSYDPLYEQITSQDEVRIVNFGENIHDQLLSPRYFERYLVPFYEKRAAQLKRSGIYTHIHIDGFFHSLLPYLEHLPFDGLEALTPLPQGDVSLEEMREHMGRKVLVDGIPAVMFLPTYSRDELMGMVERIVEMFHPRLVLGISDELPEGSGEEGIERVKMISEWCQSHQV